MTGLVPPIHDLDASLAKSGVAGTTPAMTRGLLSAAMRQELRALVLTPKMAIAP
jgi:hypothetical protein